MNAKTLILKYTIVYSRIYKFSQTNINKSTQQHIHEYTYYNETPHFYSDTVLAPHKHKQKCMNI